MFGRIWIVKKQQKRMKEQLLDNINDCPNCGKNTSIGSIICKSCNAVLMSHGFSGEEVYQKVKRLEKNRQRIRQSRYIFYVLALFNFTSIWVSYKFNNEFFYQNLVISFIYIALGLLTYRSPVTSFLIGFLLYSGIIIISLSDFSMHFTNSGVIIHIIVFSFLTLGLVSSFTEQQIQKELYGN